MARQRGTTRKTVFKGIPVVPGIAMGQVALKFRKTQVFSDRSISASEVPREIERLTEAVRLSRNR
jgi:phosphoenolpyruvate-protein kinase (PTS system EI component)